MKFYYKTLAFASLLALAACSDFDEMNTNPYEPPYSPGTSNTDVSPEGIDIANTSAGFHEKACTYVYPDDWSRNRWDHFYNDRTANEYAQIIKVCHFVNKDKYWNEFYVTRIYYAFLISMQTDTYGDIPLSYYIKGMLPPT